MCRTTYPSSQLDDNLSLIAVVLCHSHIATGDPAKGLDDRMICFSSPRSHGCVAVWWSNMWLSCVQVGVLKVHALSKYVFRNVLPSFRGQPCYPFSEFVSVESVIDNSNLAKSSNLKISVAALRLLGLDYAVQ
eukprot:scaffold2363_cov159-Amphora_coffeaeformis.AAC.13